MAYVRGIEVEETELIFVHQGKSRWHSYHVLVYISHVLTYLFGTVPCTLRLGYINVYVILMFMLDDM